jgi:Fic family protein
MAEKEWARLYTDEQYLSKSEVMQAMQTSLIDGYWNDITEYRKRYRVPLLFRSITNHAFYLTETDIIKAKVTAIELKSARFLGLIRKIIDPQQEEAAHRSCLLTSLRAINSIENAQMSELSLKALLNGTYQEANPFHKSVIGYRDALLNEVKDSSFIRLNDDFLAELYEKNLGVSELTSFYRTRDFDSSAQRARYMYNPDFAYAPFDLIEALLGEFLSWLRNGAESPFIKAVASAYFFDYVKPFEERNDEMGLLLGKAAYSFSDEGKAVFYLPLENILIKTPRAKNVLLEVQRTGDLTYFLLYAISVVEPLLDTLEQELQSIRIEPYRKEYQSLSEGEEQSALALAKKTPVEPTQMDLFAKESEEKPVSPAPVIPSPLPTPTPVLSEPEEEKAPEVPPMVSNVAPTPAPKAEEEKPAAPSPEVPPQSAPEVASPLEKPAFKNALPPERKITPEEMAPSKDAALSLSLPKTGLSDKEVKEYVLYLLESNPNLNKNQASFLASHCTLGRYYTIQQFKKFTRCAYETARTSMDKLAQEHYYEKLQVKNKFVYTPLPKGEKNQ